MTTDSIFTKISTSAAERRADWSTQMPEVRLDLIDQFLPRAGAITLSKNGHLVGLRFIYQSEPWWYIFDIVKGYHVTLPVQRYGRWIELSPRGDYFTLFVERGIEVATVDDTPTTRVFSTPDTSESDNALCFSADGNYLWATIHNSTDGDQLAVLDIATMTIAATVPIPPDEESFYIRDHCSWSEPVLTPHPTSNIVAVSQQAGDTFLGIFFFQYVDNYIQPLGSLSGHNSNINRILYNCFSEDSGIYLVVDIDYVAAWQFPSLQPFGPDLLAVRNSDEDEHIYGIVFLDSQHAVFIIGHDDLVPDRGVYIEIAYELRVIEVTSGASVARYPLPLPLEEPHLAGRTLVGIHGQQTLIYQIDWIDWIERSA